MLLIPRVPQFQTTLLLFLVPVASEKISVSPAFPEMYQVASISCFSAEDRIWFHNGNHRTTCTKKKCVPSTDSSRIYVAEEDKTKVIFASIDRTHDGGVWTCKGKHNNSINLDVYSFPPNMSLIQGGETDGDLARSQVTLQCQTGGCTYPVPVIKWYYKDVMGLALPTTYKETGTHQMRNDGVSCNPPEKLYSSNLILPVYTTWHDNNKRSATFACGMNYLNASRTVFSEESKIIAFAVHVTEIKLHVNNQPQSEQSVLTLTSGETVTLTCVPGISRPDPTIEWYIGSQLKCSSSSHTFTLTPGHEDHDKMIFCRAYNIDTSRKVESSKIKLYVKESLRHPVYVGMGAGTAVLIVTVVALVIVILRKRPSPDKSQGVTSEETEAPRSEVVREVPAGGESAIPAEYEGLELQESADNRDANLRRDVGRLILQTSANNISSDVYESPTSIKSAIHSCIEHQEVTEERKEKAIDRSKVTRAIIQVPRSNTTATDENDVTSSNQAEVKSYLEVQDLPSGHAEEITANSEVERVILQSPGNNSTCYEYEIPIISQNVHSYLEILVFKPAVKVKEVVLDLEEAETTTRKIHQ